MLLIRKTAVFVARIIMCSFILALTTTQSLARTPERNSDDLVCDWTGELIIACKTPVCVNDPGIRIGGPPVILKVNFSTGFVDLNGIPGRIFPGSGAGSARVVWDLRVLGAQEITRENTRKGTVVALAGQNHRDGFRCRARH